MSDFDPQLFSFLQNHYKSHISCAVGGNYTIRIKKVDNNEWYETMRSLSENGYLKFYKLNRKYQYGVADFTIEYTFSNKIIATRAFFKL